MRVLYILYTLGTIFSASADPCYDPPFKNDFLIMNNDTEMDASQNSQSTPPTITENVSYKVRSHLKNLILSIKDKYFPPIKVLIDES